MNLLIVSMLSSAGISGARASRKARRPLLWLALGVIAGPIAVAILLWLPSRAKRPSEPIVHPRSIVDEINAQEEMQQQGIISADEFQQGKAQVLACPSRLQSQRRSPRNGSGRMEGGPGNATRLPPVPPSARSRGVTGSKSAGVMTSR